MAQSTKTRTKNTKKGAGSAAGTGRRKTGTAGTSGSKKSASGSAKSRSKSGGPSKARSSSKSKSGGSSKARSSSKSASKKAASYNAASARRSAAREQVIREKEANEREIKNDIALVVLLIVMSFLFLSLLDFGGGVGKVLSSIMFGLFGIGAWFVPFYLFAACLFMVTGKGGKKIWTKMSALLLLLLVLESAGHLYLHAKGVNTLDLKFNVTRTFNLCAAQRRGGGVIGGSFAALLYYAFRMIGSCLILFGFTIIALLLLLPFSPGRAVRKWQESRRDDDRPGRAEHRALYRQMRLEELEKQENEQIERETDRLLRREEKREARRAKAAQTENGMAVRTKKANRRKIRSGSGTSMDLDDILLEKGSRRTSSVSKRQGSGIPSHRQSRNSAGRAVSKDIHEIVVHPGEEKDPLTIPSGGTRTNRSSGNAGRMKGSIPEPGGTRFVHSDADDFRRDSFRRDSLHYDSIEGDDPFKLNPFTRETGKGSSEGQASLITGKAGSFRPAGDLGDTGSQNRLSDDRHEIHVSFPEQYPDNSGAKTASYNRSRRKSGSYTDSGPNISTAGSDTYSMYAGEGAGGSVREAAAAEFDRTAGAAGSVSNTAAAGAAGLIGASGTANAAGTAGSAYDAGAAGTAGNTGNAGASGPARTTGTGSGRTKVSSGRKDGSAGAGASVSSADPADKNSRAGQLTSFSETDPGASSGQKQAGETFDSSETGLEGIAVHRENRKSGRSVLPGPRTAGPRNSSYVHPPFNLLESGSGGRSAESEKELRETAYRLQETLRTFGVQVTITDISQGPSVTRYELKPDQGVKVSRILNLADDIKLRLAATDIRIEAPIPGKSAVGIEVPNKYETTVHLRDLIESRDFRSYKGKLPFAVGKDIGGKSVFADISRMPHLLIAGATGSGKSVCINTIILSILYSTSPDEVKLLMIDPKVVELSVYKKIPHLIIPVVTDAKKASAALNWAVAEMEKRYKLFAAAGVRDLNGFNALAAKYRGEDGEPQYEPFPRLIIIVDELADLMMVAKSEVESAICRLAQLARAAGIHLIIATQRPSVDVITGLIKANMPSRIAFAVSSQVDSRTILDMAGAEKLIGRGDMLFYPQNYQKPARIQGAFVSDDEVSRVVEYITSNNIADSHNEEVNRQIEDIQVNGIPGPEGTEMKSDPARDEYFEKAGRYIIEKNKASIGLLQRVYKIGFNRAARIMDQLAEAGVVSEESSTRARQILMTLPEFEAFLENE